MDKNARFIEVKEELDKKSPSFCLAKWKQVTVHMQNGMTHSCHHPVSHKIPLRELETTPSALHNTKFKKFQRKMMLEGVRPSECDYCWKIEDAHPDNMSDRIYKSSEDWAFPHYEEIAHLPASHDVNPSYVEVSFGNECHFKCAYCSPTVSSAILSEYLKFGHYQSIPYYDLKILKAHKTYPYQKDEHNPYVEAFWKWWPELSQELEVFRITGGEPLLNPNTFQFLESLIQNPLPKLDLAINSNLSVPDAAIKRFTELSKKIVEGNLVKKYEIYTSLDTFGKQAEYVRFGLDMDRFIHNVRFIMESLPSVKMVFMCTFNIFSIPGFEKFLELMAGLKREYKETDYTSRIQLSISYLRYPRFLAANVAPLSFIPAVEASLDYMLRHAVGEKGFETFSEFEISQLRRILEWLKHNDLEEDQRKKLQMNFREFILEYDMRKQLSFQAVFPEFSSFMRELEAEMDTHG